MTHSEGKVYTRCYRFYIGIGVEAAAKNGGQEPTGDHTTVPLGAPHVLEDAWMQSTSMRLSGSGIFEPVYDILSTAQLPRQHLQNGQPAAHSVGAALPG